MMKKKLILSDEDSDRLYITSWSGRELAPVCNVLHQSQLG